MILNTLVTYTNAVRGFFLHKKRKVIRKVFPFKYKRSQKIKMAFKSQHFLGQYFFYKILPATNHYLFLRGEEEPPHLSSILAYPPKQQI